jgi:hypothetical protein
MPRENASRSARSTRRRHDEGGRGTPNRLRDPACLRLFIREFLDARVTLIGGECQACSRSREPFALPPLQLRHTASKHLDRVCHQLDSSNEVHSLRQAPILGRHEWLDHPASPREHRIDICVGKHHSCYSHLGTIINRTTDPTLSPLPSVRGRSKNPWGEKRLLGGSHGSKQHDAMALLLAARANWSASQCRTAAQRAEQEPVLHQLLLDAVRYCGDRPDPG